MHRRTFSDCQSTGSSFLFLSLFCLILSVIHSQTVPDKAQGGMHINGAFLHEQIERAKNSFDGSGTVAHRAPDMLNKNIYVYTGLPAPPHHAGEKPLPVLSVAVTGVQPCCMLPLAAGLG